MCSGARPDAPWAALVLANMRFWCVCYSHVIWKSTIEYLICHYHQFSISQTLHVALFDIFLVVLKPHDFNYVVDLTVFHDLKIYTIGVTVDKFSKTKWWVGPSRIKLIQSPNQRCRRRQWLMKDILRKPPGLQLAQKSFDWHSGRSKRGWGVAEEKISGSYSMNTRTNISKYKFAYCRNNNPPQKSWQHSQKLCSHSSWKTGHLEP